ncbi:MAG: elongation factor P [Candidatus Berkelbacteria bacterium]|nr:elongation factor P [Candidatus Berkelbacteria bacterium]
MLNINDLKIGTRIIFNGAPYVVTFSQHSKSGRSGAVLRSKIKNLIDGSTVDHTFAGAEKIEPAELETKKAQFLYKDNENFFFMDSKTFEQFSLSKKQIGDLAKFLKENSNVDLLYFNDAPINIQLPIKMSFKVTYTEPGFKGNTASTVTKPATIETGAEVNVPLFIKENDNIVLDTRTGEYVERG